MDYRPLGVANIESVIPLYIGYYNAHGSEWTAETAYRRLHQVVTMDGALGLVAEDGGEAAAFVMGFMQQYDDGEVYTLEEIVVAEARQGQGVGTALMKEIERRVRGLGAILIQLQSVNDGQHAVFYGRLGYLECSNLIPRSKVL